MSTLIHEGLQFSDDVCVYLLVVGYFREAVVNCLHFVDRSQILPAIVLMSLAHLYHILFTIGALIKLGLQLFYVDRQVGRDSGQILALTLVYTHRRLGSSYNTLADLGVFALFEAQIVVTFDLHIVVAFLLAWLCLLFGDRLFVQRVEGA